jgi:hypothetical protein
MYACVYYFIAYSVERTLLAKEVDGTKECSKFVNNTLV